MDCRLFELARRTFDMTTPIARDNIELADAFDHVVVVVEERSFAVEIEAVEWAFVVAQKNVVVDAAVVVV